jgi:hypothetical protein
MLIRLTRNLSVLAISLALSFTSLAQDASRIYIEPSGWSIGTNVGLSDMWGDIGTRSPIDHYTNSKYFDKVTFMGGLFGRYTIHPALAVRLQVNYGSLYATDNWNYDKARNSANVNDDAVQRYLRSQNAKDVMFEGMALLEFTPLRFNPESKLAHKKGQPFIAAGLAYFHFTPYSTSGSGTRYISTYDLHLEGQGWGAGYPPSYSLWQPAIPVALGYRWDLGKHLNLGIEYMYRFTFTDYLDGVSNKYLSLAQYQAHLSPADAALAYAIEDKQPYFNHSQPNNAGNMRGNPSNNDSYSTITITFYYKVLSRTKEWWH